MIIGWVAPKESEFRLLNRSELHENSQSHLQQVEKLKVGNINQMVFTRDESSFEISGFSNIVSSGDNYSAEVTDPFINQYILPNYSFWELNTNIYFYAKPLFNTIISVLDLEKMLVNFNWKLMLTGTFMYTEVTLLSLLQAQDKYVGRKTTSERWLWISTKNCGTNKL